MKIGDSIYTPRFCTCRINEVIEDAHVAYEAGYREPTHYDDNPDYDILGKHIGTNRMVFAAVKKPS